MKIKIAMFLGIFLFISCSDFSKNDPLVDNNLSKLLTDKDYFKLRKEFKIAQNQLSEDKLLYYKTHCANVFNEGDKSNEYADILLNKYKNALNDTAIAKLLAIKANNYVHSYQYKEAAEAYQVLLDQYKNVLDSTDLAEYQNELQTNRALEYVKPQLIHLHNDVEIQASRNKFNHLMVPVKSGGETDDFIFDTGAGISVISESYAQKMNLTIYETDIDVWSSNDITIKSQLAVADTFQVGKITFENVVFLMMPDKQLSFPSLNYEIHGIVGFPVILQMEELHMYKNGTIMVPKEVNARDLNNMYFEGSKPIIQATSNNDTLIFTLDTGAKGSELYNSYYLKYKEEIQKNGEFKVTQRGAAGGVIDVEEYLYFNFPYQIGTKSNVLPKISVVMSENTAKNKGTDGNLGQDVILQFNKLILNFKYMYIDLE